MAVGVAPNGSPASQTLIVPELPPDTILEPSEENCTDLMPYGSAFSWDVLSSRVAVEGAQKGRQRRGEEAWQKLKRLT